MATRGAAGPEDDALPDVGAPADGVSLLTLEVYGIDCPVPPAVWRQFTSPAQEVDLILETRQRASAPMVARALLSILSQEGSTPDVMTVSDFVVISVTVTELVAGVLPLTGWQPLVEKAGRLKAEHFRQVLDDIDTNARLRDRPGWEIQDLGRFRWLVAQLRRVLGDEATVEHLVALCDRAARGAAESNDAPVRTVAVNRAVYPAVLESRVTVKADAAERVFEVDAQKVTWAVVDSGIDRGNIAFRSPGRADAAVRRVVAAFDVPRAVKALRAEDPTSFVGLVDGATWDRFAHLADCTREDPTPTTDPVVRHHGTHVAGILGADERGHRLRPTRPALVGVCPTIRLVDLKVFDDDGRAEELWVLVALRFVQWLNETGRLPDGRHIDGVNLSISTPYDVDAQACGGTPVCEEAARLVDSGVVVVAAAGNQAYDSAAGPLSVGTGFRFLSITDPGNAEDVITVGATDKRSPHKYGPIAGSGRGPTADGRHKPDLLAPGYLVTGPTFGAAPQPMTGTSQAAPHVSGVAAMLLARYPELRGDPRRVKEIVCGSATDLGRLQDFQGAGLLDALRALQLH
jgi:serine protease AprX